MVLARRATYQGPERLIQHERPDTIARRLAHLLLLPRFDTARCYHLRQVRPLGLGVVAGGRPTLGYSTLEHFLGDLEALHVAVPLGDALAERFLAVWPAPEEGGFLYFDNRRKVRYSTYATAAGKISATDRILGGTTQLFAHDAAGHALHMCSGPADDHLSRTLLPFARHLIGLAGRERVRGVVCDQEMRSVALFLALDALDHLAFVTVAGTPSPAQEAALEVEGVFVPHLRDPQTGETTHWVAHGHTLLQDHKRGLSFEAEVTLLLDARAGLPGRLIPILHNLRAAETAVGLPHRVYVGRWEAQERVFRDMRACQNLDVHYGQKKRAVPNRVQQRARAVLCRDRQRLEKQVAATQEKAKAYAEQAAALEQEIARKHGETRDQVAAIRQASRAALTPRERERLAVQAERLAARGQLQQARLSQRRCQLSARQRDQQKRSGAKQGELAKTVAALDACQERPLYDFDLEKDDVMTYLRMAGENAHRFTQERYFAGTCLEKVDEATMVRVVYKQPGWVRHEGQRLHVLLQGYGDPELQAAVEQACRRVNEAGVTLPSGHLLHIEVAAQVLDW